MSTTPASATTTRFPLPEGTIPVGISLLIAGVATYAFFKVGTVAVGGPEEFAPLAAMWFAVFALAPGFFLPLEQELGRALSHRRAVGEGGRPVVRKVVRLGVTLIVIVTLAILALSPLIATSYFNGDWFMVVALIAAFAVFGAAKRVDFGGHQHVGEGFHHRPQQIRARRLKMLAQQVHDVQTWFCGHRRLSPS